MCDPSLFFCRLIITGGMHHVKGLALHTRYGRLYYSYINDDSARIESANLDGSDRRVLVSGGKLKSPVAIALDQTSDWLYFADVDLELIERVHVLTLRRFGSCHCVLNRAVQRGRPVARCPPALSAVGVRRPRLLVGHVDERAAV